MKGHRGLNINFKKLILTIYLPLVFTACLDTDGDLEGRSSSGSSIVADNLGDHLATQNIVLGGNYLSGDGGDEGVYVDGDGDVGIGVTLPESRLQVAGGIQFGDDTDTCDGTKAGTIRYRTGVVEYCNGTTWASVASGGAGDNLGNHTATTDLDLANNIIENVNVGTALLPSISFNGDANTGVWSPAADNVAISTNGSEALRVLASGNVGVGTTNPSGFLSGTGSKRIELRAEGSSELNIRSTGPSSGHNSALSFSNQTYRTGYVQVNKSSTSTLDGALTLGTSDGTQNATEKMRIAPNGNVGIGTTNPEQKLSIETDGGDANLLYRAYENGVFSNFAYYQKARGTRAAPLPVQGSDRFAIINFMGYDGDSFENGASIQSRLDGNVSNGNVPGRLDFFTTEAGGSHASRMSILESGFVGIGTTTPNALLTVNNGATIGRYEATGWTHTSDRRLKRKIAPLESDDSLEKVLKLKPVAYVFKTDEKGKKQVGFIAQDVESIFPEVVTTDSKGFKAMAYANLVAPLVKAFQKLYDMVVEENDLQNEIIASQATEIEVLRVENAKLNDRLSKLEKLIESLPASN